MKGFRCATGMFVILAAFLLFCPLTAPAAVQERDRVIQLTPGELTALVNDAAVQLDVPAFIDSGHTLVPLRFVGETLETAVGWHAETKTVVVSVPGRTIEIGINQPEAVIDGQPVPLSTPARIKDGRTVVPLRFIGEALGATVHFEASTKLITITHNPAAKTPPEARFSLAWPTIKPGEGVEVRDESFHPENVDIVERVWTGLADSYERAGKYQISLRVRDANGNWSEPFSRELIVNTPPVAEFRTEKAEYKIGEPTIYINRSYDPDGHELSYRWTNQEPVFFEPGKHTVVLVAEDHLGGRSSFELPVVVTDEVHYTRTEYYLLYGELKQVIPFEEKVLDLPVLAPPVQRAERTLLRSNSPEELTTPGLLYRDSASGPVRLMVHHLNKSGTPLKIHVLATNAGGDPVTASLTRQGLSRPSTGILHQGREYLADFFGTQSPKAISIPPGKTIDLLPSLAAGTLQPGFCVSALFDLTVNGPVVFSFVAVLSGTDPVTALPTLPTLPPDGQHTRGTFPTADLQLTFPAEAARPDARLVLGDLEHDPPISGTDALTGEQVLNSGNYGVVYEIVFERLEKDTALLLNPRGGLYCGALSMNNLVWETPVEKYLSPQRQAVIIQRMQFPGRVRVEYSPPSGSYLPVNFLLLDLPENKDEKTESPRQRGAFRFGESTAGLFPLATAPT